MTACVKRARTYTERRVTYPCLTSLEYDITINTTVSKAVNPPIILVIKKNQHHENAQPGGVLNEEDDIYSLE